MLPQDTDVSLVLPAGANGASKDDSFAKHSFPPDGLVALSRAAYQQTPLGAASSSSAEPEETSRRLRDRRSARSSTADLALVSRRSNARSLPRFRKRRGG